MQIMNIILVNDKVRELTIMSPYRRWKLVQLGLDDQYKRLNEVRGKERVPNTQVFIVRKTNTHFSALKNIYSTLLGFPVCCCSPTLGKSNFPQWSALLHKVSFSFF